MKNLLVVLGFMILSTCDAFDNENPDLLDLQGTWELQSFSGGIGGWATDLDTVDYTISLEVIREKADWKRDDNIELSYNIVRSSQSDFLLKFNPIETNTEDVKSSKHLVRIDGNEMVILDSCSDCFIYNFIRSGD